MTVLAVDGGVPARTGSLSVIIRVSDVTDDGPRFDHVTYDVTLAENAPLSTVVASVRATSDRRDANIRYSFDEQTTSRYGQVRLIGSNDINNHNNDSNNTTTINPHLHQGNMLPATCVPLPSTCCLYIGNKIVASLLPVCLYKGIQIDRDI